MNTARRARSVIPPALEDRARLVASGRLEARTRRGGDVRGAAFVLHAVGPATIDPRLTIDPPFPAHILHDLVGHLRGRYELVSAGDLLPRALARRAGEPVPVALTFDDDLVSHVDAAAPALWAHGVTGTAFLCGACRPFWWQLLQEVVDGGALGSSELPGLDPRLVAAAVERSPRAIRRLARAVEELSPGARDRVVAALTRRASSGARLLPEAGRRQLTDAGWSIGFHTRRHDALPGLDDRALADALAGGQEALPEAALATFAYPHGKAGAREATAVRAAGYAGAFTGVAGVVTAATAPYLVPRLQPSPLSPGRTVLGLARALSGG